MEHPTASRVSGVTQHLGDRTRVPTVVWRYLQGALLRRYAQENRGINVLAGPVFDYNYDGRRDTLEEIRE